VQNKEMLLTAHQWPLRLPCPVSPSHQELLRLLEEGSGAGRAEASLLRVLTSESEESRGTLEAIT
jgi:hypothetical protein